MAGDIIHAGIKFNRPAEKYMKFDFDAETLELDVYLTGIMEGSEVIIKGTISEWAPVVQEG